MNSENLIAKRFKISKITKEEVYLFWPVFKKILETGFPEYQAEVIHYFLTKIYPERAFVSWISSGWKVVLAVKKKEKIIGFAVIDKPYGGVCFLRWLGVLKEFRNMGAGKSLIKAWINYAQKYGCHKVELAAREKAKEFYQKCGLKLEGKREKSYFGINQYIFGKVISQPDPQIMIKE